MSAYREWVTNGAQKPRQKEQSKRIYEDPISQISEEEKYDSLLADIRQSSKEIGVFDTQANDSLKENRTKE